MKRLTFDAEGHLEITPQDLLAATNDPDLLVSRVLCRGTPAVFRSYSAYREFVELVADRLRVSAFSVWIRGSAHIGFSVTPHAGKVWMELGDDSDIDLAIVDPDRYHLLDTEIRHWERRATADDRERVGKLRNSRRFHTYHHDDLPSTPACNEYRTRMAAIAKDYKRRITAFFFRDPWALHDRYVYDIQDLRTRSDVGLPVPAYAARKRRWDMDIDLGNNLYPRNTEDELNLARTRAARRSGITNVGLQCLGGLGSVRKLWVDACDIDDNGIKALGTSHRLEFLSVADTAVTNGCLIHIIQQFPNLKTLVADYTYISSNAFKKYFQTSRVTTASVRQRRRLRLPGNLYNADGVAVKIIK